MIFIYLKKVAQSAGSRRKKKPKECIEMLKKEKN